ncbi:MAG: hypothetical protein P1U42_09595 [Phycisphaerales bacterium]|nr:hypothetical protein [Phycisphaerales bacterium]
MLDEPTQLIIPHSEMIGSSTSALSFTSALLIIAGLIVLGVCVWYVYRRKHGVDQGELAFRSISRRIGLTRSEINIIRNHANLMGMTTPVGIVMSPDLMNQVLDGTAS